MSSVPQPGAAMGRDKALPCPLNPRCPPNTCGAEPDHCVASGSPRVWVLGAGRALVVSSGGEGARGCVSLHGTVLLAELGTLSSTSARREPRSWGAEHFPGHILARMGS